MQEACGFAPLKLSSNIAPCVSVLLAVKNKSRKPLLVNGLSCRGDRIRTCDLLTPRRIWKPLKYSLFLGVSCHSTPQTDHCKPSYSIALFLEETRYSRRLGGAQNGIYRFGSLYDSA